MKINFRPACLALSVAAIIAANVVSAEEAVQADRVRASQLVGMDIARSLDPLKQHIDTGMAIQTAQALLAGGEPPLADEEIEEVRSAFQAQLQAAQVAEHEALVKKNLSEGEAFLEANRSEDGVKATPSGLQYKVLRDADGAHPAQSSTVEVHYAGTLLDGTVFDSSYERGEPARFALSQMIPGWSEGLQLMSVGSKFKFWIPADLAYGERGAGPIGPNATLVFEVELLSVDG